MDDNKPLPNYELFVTRSRRHSVEELSKLGFDDQMIRAYNALSDFGDGLVAEVCGFWCRLISCTFSWTNEGNAFPKLRLHHSTELYDEQAVRAMVNEYIKA